MGHHYSIGLITVERAVIGELVRLLILLQSCSLVAGIVLAVIELRISLIDVPSRIGTALGKVLRRVHYG